MQANLVIDSKSYGGGKKQTTTITHLRPSQKSHAMELATALNALTTNEFVGASVNEIDVDITGKTEPTLTISAWSGTTTSTATITYTGDGQLFCNCTSPARIDGNAIMVNASTFTGTIYATETSNYTAKTLEISR